MDGSGGRPSHGGQRDDLGDPTPSPHRRGRADDLGYDQEEYAQRLFYAERPIGASLEAVAAARRSTADILDRLDEEQWARGGTHTESGPYDVEAWLEIYATHAHDHADQIRRARESTRPL